MTDLIVAIALLILVVAPLAGWVVRADRRRRRAASYEREEVV